MPNRIVKEAVWSSESLSKVSLLAQGLFLRLLPLPDDHGCFDARVTILRARLFPLNYAQVTEKILEKWIQELIAVDCIRVWMDSGVRYGYFPSWSKHQQVRSLHHRKTPPPPLEIVACEHPKTAVENKDDSNCYQVPAVESLNPILNPNPNLINTHTYGEFGHVQLTDKQHENLMKSAAGNADLVLSQINRFDRWAEEQPKKTKDRVPYLTILNWIEIHIRDGPPRVRAMAANTNGGGKSNVREANERAVKSFIDRHMAPKVLGDLPDVREDPG